ncbi:MAG: fimbrial major subunit CsuA/B family protein [Oligoflexia bacterium]|nr:fimbrial major subunit CsuA/B family protein [Oligoflexia bacterium]
MKLIYSLVLFLSTLAAIGGPCNFTISGAPIVENFIPTGLDATYSVNISDPSTGPNNLCRRYFVTFSKGSANTYSNRKAFLTGSDTLDYNLYKRSNQRRLLKDFADSNNNSSVLNGRTDRDLNPTFYFYLFPEASDKRGGTYSDTILVSLYSGRINRTNFFEDSFNMNVNINVPKYANVSLVERNGAYDEFDTSQFIDFSTLTTGESGSFDVRIKSNAGYSLSIVSQNGNKMKHLTQNSFIDYQFFVDGNLQSVSNSPTVIGSGVGITPAAGSVHQIDIVVGNVANKLSGAYRDNLTLTVTTTE